MFSVLGYADLLDLGLQQTSIRFLSRSLGQKNDAETASIFRTVRLFYLRIGLAMALLWPLVAFVVSRQFGGAGQREGALILGLLGLSQALTFGLRAYPALLKANLRFSYIIIAAIVRTTIFTFAVLFWQSHGFGILQLLALHLILSVCEQAALRALARPLVPRWREAERLSSAKRQDLRAFAGKNVIGSLTAIFRDRIDPQLLAAFANLGAVTQHAVGIRLPFLFLSLQTSLFGSQFMAAFSQMDGSGQHHDQKEMCLAAIRFASIPALTGAVSLWFLGPAFILRWLGPEFAIAGQITQWVGVSTCLVAAQYPLFSYLSAVNRYGRLVGLTLAVSILRAILSIWAIRHYGVQGAAACAASEGLFHSFFTYPILGSSALDRSPLHYLCDVVLKPIAGVAAVSLPFGTWLCRHFTLDDYPSIAFCAAGIATTAMLAGYWVTLTSSDRKAVLDFLRTNRIQASPN
jgi:O-antigen/teichoic acid export membrane protein